MYRNEGKKISFCYHTKPPAAQGGRGEGQGGRGGVSNTFVAQRHGTPTQTQNVKETTELERYAAPTRTPLARRTKGPASGGKGNTRRPVAHAAPHPCPRGRAKRTRPSRVITRWVGSGKAPDITRTGREDRGGREGVRWRASWCRKGPNVPHPATQPHRTPAPTPNTHTLAHTTCGQTPHPAHPASPPYGGRYGRGRTHAGGRPELP